MGLFLHTPFPEPGVLMTIPAHAALVRGHVRLRSAGFPDRDRPHRLRRLRAPSGRRHGTGRRPPRRVRPRTCAPASTRSASTPRRSAPKPNWRRTGRQALRLRESLAGRRWCSASTGSTIPRACASDSRRSNATLRTTRAATATSSFTADRAALARRRPDLPRDPPRARSRVRPHQRPLRRARLGAAALPQPRLPARHADAALRRGADRPGDPAARRHEPGRQGIRRRPGPGRPRRAGPVAIRRRRPRVDRRPHRQPV